MTKWDKSRQEYLTEHPVRVLELSELLEERGIRPEDIIGHGEISEDGELAVELDKAGARRSAKIECTEREKQC